MDGIVPGTRESSAKRIQDALIDDIAAGQIAPGERLDETRLAERFGVSRTPVREALNRLTAQGILVQGNRRGVRVNAYSNDQLAQIFEAMYEIEAVCARLAAQRMTLMSRSRIEAAQRRCVAVADLGDRAEYLRANEAFHLAIYEATANPFLADLAADFRRRTGPFRAKKFRTSADLTESANQHDELLACIFSADLTTAEAGMRSHMTQSFAQVLAAIQG